VLCQLIHTMTVCHKVFEGAPGRAAAFVTELPPSYRTKRRRSTMIAVIQ
jgi:hypothetical protein